MPFYSTVPGERSIYREFIKYINRDDDERAKKTLKSLKQHKLDGVLAYFDSFEECIDRIPEYHDHKDAAVTINMAKDGLSPAMKKALAHWRNSQRRDPVTGEVIKFTSLNQLREACMEIEVSEDIYGHFVAVCELEAANEEAKKRKGSKVQGVTADDYKDGKKNKRNKAADFATGQSDNPVQLSTELKDAQAWKQEVICWKCEKKGHVAYECKTDLPFDEDAQERKRQYFERKEQQGGNESTGARGGRGRGRGGRGRGRGGNTNTSTKPSSSTLATGANSVPLSSSSTVASVSSVPSSQTPAQSHPQMPTFEFHPSMAPFSHGWSMSMHPGQVNMGQPGRDYDNRGPSMSPQFYQQNRQEYNGPVPTSSSAQYQNQGQYSSEHATPSGPRVRNMDEDPYAAREARQQQDYRRIAEASGYEHVPPSVNRSYPTSFSSSSQSYMPNPPPAQSSHASPANYPQAFEYSQGNQRGQSQPSWNHSQWDDSQMPSHRIGSVKLAEHSRVHAPRYPTMKVRPAASMREMTSDRVNISVGDGNQYVAIPDTGSHMTIVSTKLVARHPEWIVRPPPPDEVHELEMANGTLVPRIGSIELPIMVSFEQGYFPPRHFIQEVEVMDSNEPFLLGKDLVKILFPRGEHLYECLPDDSSLSQSTKEVRGVKRLRIRPRVASVQARRAGPYQSSSPVHVTSTGVTVESEECEYDLNHFMSMGEDAPQICTSCNRAPSRHNMNLPHSRCGPISASAPLSSLLTTTSPSSPAPSSTRLSAAIPVSDEANQSPGPQYAAMEKAMLDFEQVFDLEEETDSEEKLDKGMRSVVRELRAGGGISVSVVNDQASRNRENQRAQKLMRKI
jgi:hypothetical protein